MKQRIRQLMMLLLSVVLVGSNVFTLPVEAGSSAIVVDEESYKTELNTALWNNPDGDVVIENGTIVFSNESTDLTRLITKTTAKLNKKNKNLVNANATIQFTSLPADQTFVFALGLASVEAMMGEPGNIEIGFTNNGGVKASVKVYDMDGEAEVLVENVTCGAVGSAMTVEAVITSEKIMTVVVNGKEICNKELSVSGEGRVGFLQTGSCGAKVSGVKIASYRYDNPENINATEDFESGNFNINAWSSKMINSSYYYVPSGTEIVQMDGNYVFKFTNTGTTYIGNKYQYSNFELTFDVPYLQRQNECDEEGNIIVPKCDNFAVSFGGEVAEPVNTGGYTNATDLIIFQGSSSVTSYNTKKSASAAEAGYPYFSSDCDKGFSVKISVIDSIITVGMKWIDEETFTDVLTYQVTEETPLGYVHIWTTASVANLAIDNLKIENKDIDPVLTEVEFKDGKIEKPEDFIYKPMERIYKEADKDTFNWYLVILPVVGVCAIAIATTVIVKKVKAKKKAGKGGMVHEKEQN